MTGVISYAQMSKLKVGALARIRTNEIIQAAGVSSHEVALRHFIVSEMGMMGYM